MLDKKSDENATLAGDKSIAPPHPQVKSLDRLAIALMLLFCASWGVQQVTAKIALSEVPAMIQATIRSFGASVIVAIYAVWREPDLFRADGTFWLGTLCGILFGLEFVGIYIGLDLSNASHVILFVYTAPFFVAVALPLFVPAERLTRLQWAGMAACFCGVALGLQVSLAASWRVFAGDVLAILGAAIWAATTVLIKATKLRELSATKILLYQLVASVPVLGAFAWARGEVWPTHVSWLNVANVAYQTVWIAAVTYLGWFWLMRRYRATEMSAFTFITPVIGVFAGYVFLGERLGPEFFLAAALVAVGLVLVNWHGARR